jgi:serine/threonine protein kinase
MTSIGSDYTIIRKIHDGLLSKVFLSERKINLIDKDIIVLKCIPFSSSDINNHFESQVLKELNHQNIMKIITSFVSEKLACVVMGKRFKDY